MGWLWRILSARWLPDHDPRDLKASATSTPWRSIRACPTCLEAQSHEECMTHICLSCGTQHEFLQPSAAVRQIVKQGRWVQTVRLRNVEYAKLNGAWTPLKVRPTP